MTLTACPRCSHLCTFLQEARAVSHCKHIHRRPSGTLLHSLVRSQHTARQVVRASASINQQTAGSHEPLFSCQMAVRDYELDAFGVVNNAVYLNYLQHARHEYLNSINFSADAVARSGCALALSEITVKYRQPLRSGDRFVAMVLGGKPSAARVVIKQSLIRLPRSLDESEEEVVAASATVVYLNEAYKPVRLPAEFVKAITTGNGLDSTESGELGVS